MIFGILLAVSSFSYVIGDLPTPGPQEVPVEKPADNKSENNHYTWNIFAGIPLKSSTNTSGGPLNIIFSGIGGGNLTTTADGLPSITSLPGTVSSCPTIAVKPAIYWKDYFGPPGPEDAVAAGVLTTTNTNGKTVSVYVGQVYDFTPKAGLQPVAVYSNSNTVLSSYGGIRAISNNIKVLCTNVNPAKVGEFLTWMSAEEAHKLDSNSDVVITGYENNYIMHTGRAIRNGQIIIGKVIRDTKRFNFYYPLGDKQLLLTTDFEVLVYTKALYRVKKN